MSSIGKKAGIVAAGLLAVLLAATLGVRLARPRLEVAPAPAVRRDRPLRSEFSIANAGRWLAARDVRAVCWVRDFRVATGGGLHNAGATPGGWQDGPLAPGARRSVLCDFGAWPAPPRSAEVLILTSHASLGLPRADAGCTRFTGSYTGEWRWEPGACPAEASKVVELFLAGDLPVMDLGQDFVP
jgi:hypothetical protein